MDRPISIYLRLIDYKSNALTSNGSLEGNIAPGKDTLDTHNTQFIRISGFSSDIEQTLSLGSTSGGAGGGKIVFNPLRITKPVDAISPQLFQQAATGTPFKTVDVFFVGTQHLIQVKHTYKLAIIKAVSWSADPDEGIIETVDFDYGGLFITVNQQGSDGKINNVVQSGWNRIKNIKDNDVNSVI